MKLVSNRKWTVTPERANTIKSWLLEHGGKERDAKGQYEAWRIRYSDATFTYYTTETLFVTDSDDVSLIEAHNYITGLIGSQFVTCDKEYLVGFDEAGKGEVLGHLILVGVWFKNEAYGDVERDIGVSDTKAARTVDYWDKILQRIDYYRKRGLLDFYLEKIPPWEFDKYKVNALLDVTYQRILLQMSKKLPLENCRIVLDDYNIGDSLDRYLSSLCNAGATVVRENQADDKYLEARVASLIAKREQQRVMAAIKGNPQFHIEGEDIGSGNAGDSRTLSWLKAWYKSNDKWPWFVKQSFSTIAEIEGRKAKYRKRIPVISAELLDPEYIARFNSGSLSIESLAIICPHCGTRSKSLKLIPREGKTTPVCVACGKELADVANTLRYYCGRIMPDSNVVIRGFLSKDLERSRFFENFTIVIDAAVRSETDNRGGKKEYARLAQFASINRIRLEDVGDISKVLSLSNQEKDEIILSSARENDAILLVADNQMKGLAQARNLFVLEL